VLYLAEVKKQTKGLIGGLKTELKLLAFQRDDQTWNTVPNEDIVSCDYVNAVGEGALVFINLNNNREVQGSPELGGNRIVRLLQYFSRMLEKAQEEQESIDNWKESLSYQSQELNRRREELEAQVQEMAQKEEELANIEQKRQEIEEAWQKLEETQQQIEQANPIVLLGQERLDKLKGLIGDFSGIFHGTDSLREKFNLIFRAIQTQQEYLQQGWNSLESRKKEAHNRVNQVEQLTNQIRERQRELAGAKQTLEEARINFEKQQTDLENKQRILGIIDVNLQSNIESKNNLGNLKHLLKDSTQKTYKYPISNREFLENLPLAELNEEVDKQRQELKKWTVLVDDQEEELNYEVQSVVELEASFNNADESQKEEIRQRLEDAQERKKMKEATLEGQRRNVEEKIDTLAQYQDVLYYRQTFEGTYSLLEMQYHNLQQEKERLEPEVNSLRGNLNRIRELIEQQTGVNQETEKGLETELENLEQQREEALFLQAQVETHEQILHPWQQGVNEIREKLIQIEQSLNRIQGQEGQEVGLLNELEQISNDL